MTSKKEIRKLFRESVFRRDGYCCAWCGNGPFRDNAEDELDAHHITDRHEMPNGGYVAENGITLCNKPRLNGEDSCHMKAEQFHISACKSWHPGMHPDDLYRLIGSSYEKAFEVSSMLD